MLKFHRLALAALALLWAAGAHAQAVNVSVANAGTTGTTVGSLAKLTGAPSTALISATGDTSGIVGVVVGETATATTGNAVIAVEGVASCTFDASGVTAGHYVINSTATAGDCADGGATKPTTTQAIGRALVTVGSGAANVLVFPPSSNLSQLLAAANTWTAPQTFTQTIETAIQLGSGSCTGTITIAQASGGVVYCSSTGTTTFNTSGTATTGLVSSFTLELTNGGAQTQHFYLSNASSEAKWPGGSQPTFTTSGLDVIVCFTHDAGTTWRCSLSEKDSK